jgi:hypothetical protein
LSRVASEGDLDAIAETLARAFENDLAWGWAFEEEGPAAAEHKLAALRAVFRFSAAAALGYGWVRVTDGVEAVALWVPPGEPEMPPAEAERFPAVILAACGEATGQRLLQVMEGFNRDHPPSRRITSSTSSALTPTAPATATGSACWRRTWPRSTPPAALRSSSRPRSRTTFRSTNGSGSRSSARPRSCPGSRRPTCGVSRAAASGPRLELG